MGKKLLVAVLLLINAEILWGMRRGNNFNLGINSRLSADQQKDFNERMRQLQNNIQPVNDNVQDNFNRQKRKLEEELERNRREQEALLKKIKLLKSSPPQWSDGSSSEDSSSDDN